MIRFAFLFTGAVLLSCTVERAEIPRPPRFRAAVSAEDSANVRTVLLSLATDLQGGDLIGLERLMDPGVTSIRAGRIARGWVEVREFQLIPMLAAYPGRRVDFWNIEMRIAGAMASVTFQYEITREAEGPSVTEAGLATAVLERRGGLWRIVHLQWSTALGSRGSA